MMTIMAKRPGRKRPFSLCRSWQREQRERGHSLDVDHGKENREKEAILLMSIMAKITERKRPFS